MKYLTAAEISQKWNISSRMAAYYCEAGRIEGAVKKGKTWFIPANAEKPVDKRFSKRKVYIQDNSDFQRGKLNINKADIDNISTIYHTTDEYTFLSFLVHCLPVPYIKTPNHISHKNQYGQLPSK